MPEYDDDYTIVAIDVIRATTTAITSVALGRPCFSVPSIDATHVLAARLTDPLLAGEINGIMPAGFDLNNSPSALEIRTDIHRPLVLLSTSGTRLLHRYGGTHTVYVACFRNYSAQAHYLAAHDQKIALIGAGSRGEFRKEDLMCCTRIAQQLFQAGFQPADEKTATLTNQWANVATSEMATGKSAHYLQESGQQQDLDFVLSHIDDLNEVYQFAQGQVVPVGNKTPHRDRWRQDHSLSAT